MTAQEFKIIAEKKLKEIPTKSLIEEVKKLKNDFSNGAGLILDVAMNILMNRLSENEFIELCRNL